MQATAALFAVGSVLGVRPLLDGTDPMAFVTPFAVFLASATSVLLLRWGHHEQARALYSGTLVLNVAVLMLAAPPEVRLPIGYPLAQLALLLVHLFHRPEQAWRLGLAVAVLSTVGVGIVAVDYPDYYADYAVLTGAVAAVLVLFLGNEVLVRINRAWVDAIADSEMARNQLGNAHAMALAANHAKTAFLASMSHELRTPLNAVIGYAELVEEELEDAEGQADVADVARIQVAARHLLGLVNQVLDLSRVEAGKLQLDLAVVDLGEEARQVTDTLQPLVAARDNRLRLRVDGVPPVWADPMRVRQILTNLVGNAAKFTERGEVRVRVGQRGDFACVEVEDTGTGIANDRLEGIFEPFEQAHAGVATEYGGSGLGLAISRRLAREMGGDITATSTPHAGSTFRLVLPLPDGDPASVPGEFRRFDGAAAEDTGESLHSVPKASSRLH